MWSLFIFIGLLIFCAHVFAAVFSRQRIPDVLLLLGLGIVVGPVLHWVDPNELGTIGSALASITLLFILFDSPQRGITPGQFAAWYSADGELCGSGVISR